MSGASGYRPICDVWSLARPRTKYHGSYPLGFLHRARALLGVAPAGAVLHVCAGKIRAYPYRGFGPNDKTLDLSSEHRPDYVQDAREPFPRRRCGWCTDGQVLFEDGYRRCTHCGGSGIDAEAPTHGCWDAVLIDRPYTLDDAERYLPGASTLPTANGLLKNGLTVVTIGGRVGVLDYLWPAPPKAREKKALVDCAREVAVIAVGTGRNNRARWFTCWERLR